MTQNKKVGSEAGGTSLQTTAQEEKRTVILTQTDSTQDVNYQFPDILEVLPADGIELSDCVPQPWIINVIIQRTLLSYVP